MTGCTLAADRLAIYGLLSHLPGACAVCLFGSLANGGADRYSDVNLQGLTTDLPASQAALAAALAAVGAIDVAWQLAASPDDGAADAPPTRQRQWPPEPSDSHCGPRSQNAHATHR